MTFERLRQFISTEMRMSQVYQPVMLMELLKNKGSASASQIAQAILTKDPTQIEYFTEIVRGMVGKVLTKNRAGCQSLLASLTADANAVGQTQSSYRCQPLK